jgi:hypothetical protein
MLPPSSMCRLSRVAPPWVLAASCRREREADTFFPAGRSRSRPLPASREVAAAGPVAANQGTAASAKSCAPVAVAVAVGRASAGTRETLLVSRMTSDALSFPCAISTTDRHTGCEMPLPLLVPLTVPVLLLKMATPMAAEFVSKRCRSSRVSVSALELLDSVLVTMAVCCAFHAAALGSFGSVHAGGGSRGTSWSRKRALVSCREPCTGCTRVFGLSPELPPRHTSSRSVDECCVDQPAPCTGGKVTRSRIELVPTLGTENALSSSAGGDVRLALAGIAATHRVGHRVTKVANP